MSGEGVSAGKESKKKKSFLGKVFRLAMFAATVYGAVTAFARVMRRLAGRLEEDNERSEKKRYLSFMSGRSLRLDGETLSAAEITAVAGGVELDLTGAELLDATSVCIRTLMSGVVIKVPPMVRVEVDDSVVLSGFVNLVPVYEKEGIPVIHLKLQSLLSGIKVEIKQ